MRFPKGALNAGRFGRIEIERPGRKPSRSIVTISSRVKNSAGMSARLSVAKRLRATADRRRQYVAVAYIRKFERVDQWLVSGDQRIRKMLVHGMSRNRERTLGSSCGILFKEVQRPLVENPFGPLPPEQSGVMEALENISFAERKHGVGIQQRDTEVCELYHDVSNS